jgi:PTS system nitrogen regulatory IIA component
MHIKDILSQANVVSLARPPEKSRLLQDLSKQAAAAVQLAPALVSGEIARREQLGSTGVGSGIAIPHARIEGVAKAFGVMARLERRIEFGAIDGAPVDIVFLLLLPTRSQGEQLTALACVTRQLRDQKVAAAIRAAKNVSEIYTAIAA